MAEAGRALAGRYLRGRRAGWAGGGERFLAAARRAARVRHRAIARVQDYGRASGIPFLVTEPVGAASLSAVLQAGPPAAPPAGAAISGTGEDRMKLTAPSGFPGSAAAGAPAIPMGARR